MSTSRLKIIITSLLGVLLVTSCSGLALPALQSAPAAPGSQPIATSASGQVVATPTPTDQLFVLPGGRLLITATTNSEQRDTAPDFPWFSQYLWLQLPDLTITPHAYLAGNYPTRDQDVVLSPDLTRLAFGHEVYTQSGDNLYASVLYSVLLAEPDTSQTTQVGSTFGGDFISHTLACGDGISWSADSQAFAFARSTQWNDYETQHPLYVYDLPTGQLKTVTIQAFSPSAFSLSPDGTQIAFTSFGDIPGLSVINVDGSGQHLLVEGWVNSNLVWHPDGKRIFYKLYEPEPGIYTVDVSTGVSALITATSDKANCLALSPDLSLLAYDDQGIRLVNPEGGEPVVLTHVETYAFVWSPDSQYIAYVSLFDPHVYVMDTAGRGKVSVFLDDTMDLSRLIGWLP